MSNRRPTLLSDLSQSCLVSRIVQPKVWKISLIQDQGGALELVSFSEPVVPLLIILEILLKECIFLHLKHRYHETTLPDDSLAVYVRPSSTFNRCAAFHDSEPAVARVLLSILST